MDRGLDAVVPAHAGAFACLEEPAAALFRREVRPWCACLSLGQDLGAVESSHG